MNSGSDSNELRRALGACRLHMINGALFSLTINLLYLAAPLYMMQVNDRVISSASESTLVMLTIALVVSLAAMSALDAVRARILTRASVRLDRLLARRVVSATVESAVQGRSRGSEPLRDLDNFRQVITGPGIHSLFDLPWAPIYILVIFVLHPLLGAFSLASALLLIALALLGQLILQEPLDEANRCAARNYAFTEMSLRNAEVVQALGMLPGLLERWGRDRRRLIEQQTLASDRAAANQAIVKFVRLTVQSLILGLGAYVVIERSATVGVMFAASILLARALQPVEQIVATWRSLVAGRVSYHRIKRLLESNPSAEEKLPLPRPDGRLSVENVGYALPRNGKQLLRGISCEIEPGEVLGVIGPSGAGKTSLARHLVGVLKPTSGTVRLDGADISSWPKESLGLHIGYLPQDIELFADSVAANISRFGSDQDEADVIDAARLAGVHEMILRMPNGYETAIGEGGSTLSGGYRQRIGLARAVYGNPSVVVLDEPNSNLDAEGDAALIRCISQLKSRGTTVVMISHRPNMLGVVDKLLVLRDGRTDAFGPRDEVLARLRAASGPVVARAAAAG